MIMNQAYKIIRKDLLCFLSFLIAGSTSFFVQPTWYSIDFKVIFCLFSLMLIIKGLEYFRVLEKIASMVVSRCTNERNLAQALCGFSFFGAMFVTNDVMILTMLPILFVIGRQGNIHSFVYIAILLIISANLGSAGTPFGNPQNLYLFSFYQMNAVEFLQLSSGLICISGLFIAACTFRIPTRPLILIGKKVEIKEKRKAILFAWLGIFVLLSIFDFLSYGLITFFVGMSVLIFQRNLLKKIDYFLLLSFVFFFISVGNLSQMEFFQLLIRNLLATPDRVFFYSILASQGISNVPTAILFSVFTEYKESLFYGVNVGGLGTLVASLANLIGYRLWASEFPNQKLFFIRQFSYINFLGLFLLTLFMWWWI